MSASGWHVFWLMMLSAIVGAAAHEVDIFNSGGRALWLHNGVCEANRDPTPSPTVIVQRPLSGS